MTQDIKKPSTPVRSAFPSGLADFDGFQKEMSRMFERFFHRDPFAHAGLPSRIKGFDLAPTVDVAERPECYDISVELPGISEKDVSVTLEDDILTISGEKKAEKIEDVKNIHIAERHYGSFQRQFSLPQDADADKVTAEFRNGVLRVTVGRSQKNKPTARQINVKAAS